jgi:hypothetical protein
MGHLSATEWVLIITTISTGICSIIAAIKGTSASKVTNENKVTLDKVHQLTNGNLTKTKDELLEERKKREYLEDVILELLDKAPSGTLEQIKAKVDAKKAAIGNRRREDIGHLTDNCIT